MRMQVIMIVCAIIKLKMLFSKRGLKISWQTRWPWKCRKHKHRVCTVVKSPWILGEVLEKSLNSIFPWKVLKFLCKSLKGLNFLQLWMWWPGFSVFFMLFGLSKIDSDLYKAFLFYAIVNHQFKMRQLKNVEKLVEQTAQAFKSC